MCLSRMAKWSLVKRLKLMRRLKDNLKKSINSVKLAETTLIKLLVANKDLQELRHKAKQQLVNNLLQKMGEHNWQLISLQGLIITIYRTANITLSLTTAY